MLASLIATAVYAGEKKHSNVSVISKGEPTYTCPGEDFILQGKMCVRNNVHKMMPVCETGILRESTCEVSIVPREVCPDNYSFDGVTCLSWQEFPPVTQCPEGYRLVSGKKKEEVYCEKNVMIDGPHICPQGTIDQGKKCVSWSHISPMWECPSGTMMEGSFCVSYEEYDCSPNHAPMGGKKHGGKHLRLLGEKHHDMVVGSKGYEEDRITAINMMCKRTMYDARIMSCPPGSYVDGKQCKIENYFEKIQEKGIMTTQTAQVSSFCAQGDYCNHGKKHGGEKHGSQCCIYHNKAPFLSCAMGYDLVGDRCLTYRPPVMICKDGKKKSKKGQCTSLEYREPIVTFKAAYSCVGKDCGGHKH